MKFRHFDFRLFPKIRSRKKKNTKLSHPDYPRDISLDKNCNLYKRDYPCFYDNLAAEASAEENTHDQSFGAEYATFSQCYETSKSDDVHVRSFHCETEPSDVSSCFCLQCACATDYLAGNCAKSATETPSTIPRTRTRIKTNPWLPSPGSSVSSSISDQHQELAAYQASSDNGVITYNTRPSTLPLSSSSRLSSELVGERRRQRRKYQEYVNNVEGGESVYKVINRHSRSPLCSLLKEEPDYETDISNCNSPVNEFLKCVKYEIDFAYEDAADELLENSAFPRDDSFNSVLNIDANIPEIEMANDFGKGQCRMRSEVDIDLTFEDSNNNMQESIDTGYGSVSRDSDFMSSDEEFEKAGDKNSDRKAATSHLDNTEEQTNKNVEFIETNIDEDVNGVDDTNTPDDIDDIGEVEMNDLEWDNEPTTQTLMLEFSTTANLCNQDMSEVTNDIDDYTTGRENTYRSPLQRYGSVKYRSIQRDGNKCTCRRRSRSLADIELSLDEKVTLLREEKSFVQKKIHEAKFEEKVRQHQLKIFRLLSGDKKHKLIMNTLHDLKSRLEDQSSRLQASYSTVISLQNNV